MTFDIFLDDLPLVPDLSLVAVAALCRLEPNEVEWAIEEHGQCESVDDSDRKLLVLPHGDKYQQVLRVQAAVKSAFSDNT